MQTEVQCPNCRTMNPAGKVFCILCGKALMMSPGSKQGAGSGAQGIQTTALPPPPAPPTPAATQSYLVPSQPPEQPSAWTQPTQAYPPPAPLSPRQAAPPPPQPQYTQPVPYNQTVQYSPPPPSFQPTQQDSQYAQPVPYQQQPTAPYAMPPQQYDQYGNPIYAPPQQYGQYGQYGPQPNQYVNVQITGAYPQGPYGAQSADAIPTVKRSTLAFWGFWLLATALAWAIAVPAGFAIWDAVDEPLINNVFRGILSNSDNAVLSLIIYGSALFLVLGAVVGVISGVLQTAVLGWRGLRSGSWAFATTIGWILGAIAGWVVWVLLNNSRDQVLTGPSASLLGGDTVGSGLLMAAVFGAVAGAVLGMVQYFGLQKHTKKAGLWILASPLAWAIAAVALVLVTNMVLQSSSGVSMNPYVAQALIGAAMGVVAGAATGGVLAAIL